MPFEILKGDILDIEVDALVNSTELHLRGLTGIDHLIHQRGGDRFNAACKKYDNRLSYGEAVYTPSYAAYSKSEPKLKCKWVIHVNIASWDPETGGFNGQKAILRSSYTSALECAQKLKCDTIAFSLMGTGYRSFPVDIALETAIKAIQEYLELCNDELTVMLVLIDSDTHALAEKRNKSLEEYMASQIRMEIPSIEELIKTRNENFIECLSRLKDERGFVKPSDLYRKAEISAAVYSKIISGKSLPSKITIYLNQTQNHAFDDAIIGGFYFCRLIY